MRLGKGEKVSSIAPVVESANGDDDDPAEAAPPAPPSTDA